MSKNKHYHNYQNYSAAATSVEAPVENEVIEEVVEETVETEVEVETAIEETVEPVVEEPVTKILGTVSDCSRLRVRKAANPSAPVICELDVDTKVMIDKAGSTNDFYKICTEAGIEGFCMRKFITIE